MVPWVEAPSSHIIEVLVMPLPWITACPSPWFHHLQNVRRVVVYNFHGKKAFLKIATFSPWHDDTWSFAQLPKPRPTGGKARCSATARSAKYTSRTMRTLVVNWLWNKSRSNPRAKMPQRLVRARVWFAPLPNAACLARASAKTLLCFEDL